MRHAAIALCLGIAAGACRCERPVMQATPDVSVVPGSLDFGRVALGESLAIAVEVRNGGRAPSPLAVSLDGPFTVDARPAELDGAGAVTLNVTFSPAQLGPATGTLTLGPGLPSVALSGEGLAACASNDPCRPPRFDFDTRTCGLAVAAEGTACSAPCLADAGTCRQGLCLGLAARCIDGDACTLDACSSDGACLNPPLVCPVTDPCRATFCDSVTGCASRAVEDGVLCGEVLCEGAHICLAGTCELRLRPTAALDCRYTEIAAGPYHTCAVTAGRGVRCWGDNENDQLGRGFASSSAPPGFAANLSGVRSIATTRRTVWASTEGGRLVQSNGPGTIPIDATSVAIGLEGDVCGLEAGTARCAGDAGLYELARDVRALGLTDRAVFSPPPEACVVHFDGGVRCGTPGALAVVPVPAPATAVCSAGAGSGCAQLGEQVYCWGEPLDGGSRILWDGGVTALALTPPYFFTRSKVCAALADRIECSNGERVEVPASLARPVRALAVGSLHGCALFSDGNVACWGANVFGALGDRGTQPLGVHLRPETATWLSSIDGWTLFEAAGQIRAIDSVTGVGDDAGGTVLLSTPSLQPGPRSGYETGCRCHAEDAGAVCSDVGPLPGVPVACLTQTPGFRSPVCVSYGGSDVRCFAHGGDGGLTVTSAWDAGGPVVALRKPLGASAEQYALVRGGDVVAYGPDASVPAGLAGVADLCLGGYATATGCARLDGGALRCWGEWVDSGTPVTPAGAWPVVRQVACGALHFCVLSGVNIVQCWGNNTYGQLGLDGPSRPQATSVPMPEPVTSIAAGYHHTCALLQSGKLACWGANGLGQLGAPSLNTSPTLRLVRQ